MKIKFKRNVEVSGFAIVLAAVWESFVRLAAVPQYLLPSPLSIAELLISDAAYFFYHMTVTMVEAILGFLIATSVATLTACGFVLFRGVERIVLPYAIGLQAVPVVAIAPLLILWFGSGLVSKIVMAAIICFFPMLINATRGLRSASDEHLRLFGVYGASRWQVLRKLRIPSALPYLFAGMRISAALAMIGAIVAEYAGADRGLGYVIMQSTYRIDTARLFAGVLCSAAGGLLLFGFMVELERRASRKRHFALLEN